MDLVGPKGVRAREARRRAIILAARAIDDGLNQWELGPYTDHNTEEEVDAIVGELRRIRGDLLKLLPPGWEDARRVARWKREAEEAGSRTGRS